MVLGVFQGTEQKHLGVFNLNHEAACGREAGDDDCEMG